MSIELVLCVIVASQIFSPRSYPDRGDPVMTEPDLVTIGAGASVDNASLVAHINSRGVFQLNELVVGEGAVMRSKTRLLSGAAMGPFSTLLENTLVVSGGEVQLSAGGKRWIKPSAFPSPRRRARSWHSVAGLAGIASEQPIEGMRET